MENLSPFQFPGSGSRFSLVRRDQLEEPTTAIEAGEPSALSSFNFGIGLRQPATNLRSVPATNLRSVPVSHNLTHLQGQT